MKLIKLNFVLSILFTLFACGGGGGSDTPSSDKGSTVSLFVNKGPVTGGRCELQDTEANVLASATPNNGRASFSGITYSGVVIASCSGGSYTDETTGKLVQLGATTLRSAKAITADNLMISITPITEIAVRLASQSIVGTTKTFASEISAANSKVADQLGLANIAITDVEPVNIYKTQIKNDDAGWYATALAAISLAGDGQTPITNSTQTAASLVAFLARMTTAIASQTVAKDTNFDEALSEVGNISAASNNIATNTGIRESIRNGIGQGGDATPDKQSQAISAGDDVTKTFATNATFTQLADIISSASGTGGISYNSSTETVAKVDNNGLVMLVGVGTSIITAIKAGDTNFNAARDSYLLVVNKANQAILNSGADVVKTFGDADFSQIASGGSGAGSITYASSHKSVATVNNAGLVHIIAAGTSTITVVSAGDNNYQPIATSYLLTVNKANQAVLNFGADVVKTFGDADFSQIASGGSGAGGVIYASSNGNIATVNNAGLVHIITAGTSTITAIKTADNNFNTAVTDNYLLTVNKANQAVLNAGADVVKTFGDADFSQIASGGSGFGAGVYASSHESVATVNNAGLVHIITAGTSTITATKTADNNHNTAVADRYLLTVNKANQAALILTNNSPKTFNNPDFVQAVSGGSGSGLISLSSSKPNIANLSLASSNTIQILKPGTTIISAVLAGDDNYNPSSASYLLTVNKAQQNPLQVGGNIAKILADDDFIRPVSGGLGSGVLSYQSSDATVASIDPNSGTITINAIGIIAITVTKAADDNYQATSATYLLAVSQDILPPNINASIETLNATINTVISPIIIANSGGVATDFSISPSLPTGLVFNSQTGQISGTLTAAQSPIVYTITASNTSGIATDTISITVYEKLAQNLLSLVNNSPKNFDDPDFIQVVNGGSGSGLISLSSSNPNIANLSLASSNTIQILKPGTTIISATKASDANYRSAAASYLLTIMPPLPLASAAYYDYQTNKLTVTGENFVAMAGADNDITKAKFSFKSKIASFTLQDVDDFDIDSTTQFSFILTNVNDLANAQTGFDKNGLFSQDGTAYKLTLFAGYNTITSVEQSVSITVSNISASLTYVADFVESVANDGAITGVATIMLSDKAQFIQPLPSSAASATNVPAGLTPVFNRISSNTLLLKFNGKAQNHADRYDVNNLTIELANNAFSSDSNAVIKNTRVDDLVINFSDGNGSLTITSTGKTTSELGGVATLNIKLNAIPNHPVTLTITSSSLTEAMVAPATLIFTTANATNNQIVVIKGLDDADVDGDQTYHISFDIHSLDGDYNALTIASLTLTNIDNELSFNNKNYGSIKSPYTERIWLDRNLGSVCISTGINACNGYFYQWGRANDGHQFFNSSTTVARASSITPSTNTFYIDNFNQDWTTADSDGLLRQAFWRKTDGSGICPTTFRVPTSAELIADMGVSNNAFLKLATYTSKNSNGNAGLGVTKRLFSSDANNNVHQVFDLTDKQIKEPGLNEAYQVRCIQNELYFASIRNATHSYNSTQTGYTALTNIDMATFSISGGANANLFNIDQNTGVLSFKNQSSVGVYTVALSAHHQGKSDDMVLILNIINPRTQTGFSAGADVVKNLAANNFTQVASGGQSTIAVIYGASNQAVASVDNNGLVTLNGVGTSTITATKTGDANYDTIADSYLLTVNPITPTISHVSYDYASNLLKVTGNNFISIAGADNDIVKSKMRLELRTGIYFNLAAGDFDIDSTTQFSLILTDSVGSDLTHAQNGFDANGIHSADGRAYVLKLKAGYNTNFSVATTSAIYLSNHPATLSYILSNNGEGFIESSSDDGSIDGSIDIAISHAIFASTNLLINAVTVTNLPAGISAKFSRVSDILLTMTLSGQAISHDNSDDVNNIGVSFGDNAFANTKSAVVNNSTTNTLSIDFRQDPANGSLTIILSKNTTTEAGTTSTLSIALTSTPTHPVTITLINSDASEAHISSTTLVFTPDNATKSQTVVITGVYDNSIDGNQTYYISLTSDSADFNYKQLIIPSVSLVNIDKNFNFDNQIYGIVTSKSGQAWLDRNLGAGQVCTSATDTLCFGDLYQWGRLADGHQKRNSGKTTTQASSFIPGHANFITGNINWTSASSNPNIVLQQYTYRYRISARANGQGICPIGFSLATRVQWQKETTLWNNKASNAYSSNLALVAAKLRHYSSGAINNFNHLYWTMISTPSEARKNIDIDPVGSILFSGSIPDATGGSVRCIQSNFYLDANNSSFRIDKGTTLTNYRASPSIAGASFSIIHGTDAASFSIDENTGVLSFKQPAVVGSYDFEINAKLGSYENSLVMHIDVTEVKAIEVSTISNNTSEAGATASFNIKLNVPPTDNVTISLSSNDLSEGIVTPAELVFTPDNATITQTVIVTGVGDSLVDGLVNYDIVMTSQSNDSDYHQFNIPTVSLANIDSIFTFKGHSYSTIKRPNGRIWLDRNLGASQTCTSIDDSNCLGDLYQWGRPADGHQLRSNTNSTTTLSNVIKPEHNQFISNNGDWSNNINKDSLRQTFLNDGNGVGICPIGYKLPNKAEWQDEADLLTGVKESQIFANLKLAKAGYRNNSGSDIASQIYYWSTDVHSSDQAQALFISPNFATAAANINKTNGLSVRCINAPLYFSSANSQTTNSGNINTGYQAVANIADATFSISGVDSNQFDIASNTGVLTFKTTPTIKNSDNVYKITLIALHNGKQSSKDINIIVLDPHLTKLITYIGSPTLASQLNAADINNIELVSGASSDADNLSLYRSIIAAATTTDFNSHAKVQAMVSAANKIIALVNNGADLTQIEYQTLGLNDIPSDVTLLAELNTLIKNQLFSAINTQNKLQILVDYVNKEVVVISSVDTVPGFDLVYSVNRQSSVGTDDMRCAIDKIRSTAVENTDFTDPGTLSFDLASRQAASVSIKTLINARTNTTIVLSCLKSELSSGLRFADILTTNASQTANIVPQIPLGMLFTTKNATLALSSVNDPSYTINGTAINLADIIDSSTNTYGVSLTYQASGTSAIAYPALTIFATITANNSSDNSTTTILMHYPKNNTCNPAGSTCFGEIMATIKTRNSEVLNPKQLDDVDDKNGTTIGQLHYPVNNNNALGTITLKIYPGILDRYFNSGNEYIYLPIRSSETGKIWLNNNLGANYAKLSASNYHPKTQAASVTDVDAYGDLYQWGRLTNGHEKSTSNTTTTISSSDAPKHNLFIKGSDDWRNPSNDNLWQGLNGINQVCPNGYRLPLFAEFAAEFGTDKNDDLTDAAQNELKLTTTGYRNNNGVKSNNDKGYYWTSETMNNTAKSQRFYLSDTNSNSGSYPRINGYAVRCIKD